jgi:hypothetical protein
MKQLIILSMLVLTFPLLSQKYLQMEKLNSTKVWKWAIGDMITYQLQGENGNWRTNIIDDIDFENKRLIFENGTVSTSDIKVVRFDIKWTRNIGYSLMTFGLASTVFDGIALAAGRNGGYFIKVGPMIFVSGWLLKTLFKHKDFNTTSNFRLRVMDLTLVPAKD